MGNGEDDPTLPADQNPTRMSRIETYLRGRIAGGLADGMWAAFHGSRHVNSSLGPDDMGHDHTRKIAQVGTSFFVASLSMTCP